MDIFQDLRDELQPFHEYWLDMFDKKRMSLVADLTAKFTHFGKLCSELFSPTIKTNKKSSNITEDLGVIVAQAILDGLQDTRKATSKYLSSSQSAFCWGNTSYEDHISGLHKMAVNDPAERSFGALTGQLQCFGRIGITHAAGFSQVRTHGDMSRGFETSSSNKKNKSNTVGFLYTLPDDLRNSLIMMALEYSPEIRKRDQELLDNQRDVKRR